MKLGAFSISLSVKDIDASREFYEKLGFEIFSGDISQNRLILRNGDCIVGLFQGMFEKNIMTFNPGWDQDARTLESYTDIRELHRELKSRGLVAEGEIDENSKGPASFMLADPDGNLILFDQHV